MGGRKEGRKNGRKEDMFMFDYILCNFESWFCLSINEVDEVGISWLTLFSVADVL